MKVGILEIEMLANLSRLSDDMRRAERVVGDSMGKVERSVANAKQAMASLGMGLSIGLIADQMRRTADTFVKLDAQIRNSTKSQQQYNQALADIRRISTIAQADISATTMLYTRLLNTTDGMGISQGKLATVTETVTYGLKAYGATSAEAASAALQLSQAIGANRLGGEEFRAVMEAMPNVMKVLAKSMRVDGIGELRALSIAGKITAAEIVKAFGDPKVAAEFRKMAEKAQTITGAWTVARNELTLMFGEFAKSSGLTQGMIAAFNGLAAALRATGQYLNDIIMLLAAWAALRVTQMVYGYVAALMAQRAAALAVAQAELTRVNMTYGASAATVAAARTSYAYAAANTTLGGSLIILGQRMMAFVSANAAAIAIVSLGVAAVALKRDFDNAIDSVTKFQEKIRGMEVDALRAARQLEVANVATMKSSIFSGFNERDILFAERRIRMMDAQIAAAEKLAKVDTQINAPGGPAGKAHQSKMLHIAQELQAQITADAEKMTNSEKVTLAWVQLKGKEQTKQEALNYAIAQQKALQLDALVAAQKAAETITDSIIKAAKANSVGQSIMQDIQAAFEKDVLRPQIKAVVLEAMPVFQFKDAALRENTAALQANTSAQSGSSSTSASSSFMSSAFIALMIAIVMKFLDRATVKFEKTIYEIAASRAGISGQRHFIFSGAAPGVNTQNQFGALGTALTNTLNAAAQDAIATFGAVGDAIGIADVRTRDYKVVLQTEGDVVAALTNGIGESLVPALRTMQREGETLADTAKRITETFKATNDFIVALGVSQGAAFGGFGLGGAAGREALIAASGGLQAFTQNAQSFVKNFLTPAQQLAPSLDAVGRTFSRLSIQGVSTNEQFAALVKQQMELGNTDVVAQLLSVADSFNAVTVAAADTNKQLTALLRKDLFSTLVDYIRATNAGAGAAGMIAGAVGAAGGVIAREAVGTSEFAQSVSATAPGVPPAIEQSGWVSLWDMIKELVKSFFDHLKDGFVGFFRKFWEQLPNLPDLSAFKDGFHALMPPLVDVKNAFSLLLRPLQELKNLIESLPNPPGIGGGGGGGGFHDPVFGLFANGGAFGASGVHAFASGGAFTNGIYSSPTPFMFANGGGFSQGVMGEAGDEAVMPLRRGPDGRLGVSMHGSGDANVAEEVRLLRAEVNMLRRDNQAGQVAIATSTQRTYKVLDRWNGEGLPPERLAG